MKKTAENEKVHPLDAKLSMAHFYVAIIALALGGFAGLLQTLVRSGRMEFCRYNVLSITYGSRSFTCSGANNFLYHRISAISN